MSLMIFMALADDRFGRNHVNLLNLWVINGEAIWCHLLRMQWWPLLFEVADLLLQYWASSMFFFHFATGCSFERIETFFAVAKIADPLVKLGWYIWSESPVKYLFHLLLLEEIIVKPLNDWFIGFSLLLIDSSGERVTNFERPPEVVVPGLCV